MKKITLLFAVLLLSATHAYSQIKITKITIEDKEHYLANVVGYPICGVYTVVNQLEPITVLNPDGTGIIQNEDLVKENIIWGIECTSSGVPIFKEGYNSASYSFWYKKEGKEVAEDEKDWAQQSFSIHFDKKKAFIAGERMKEYIE